MSNYEAGNNGETNLEFGGETLKLESETNWAFELVQWIVFGECVNIAFDWHIFNNVLPPNSK